MNSFSLMLIKQFKLKFKIKTKFKYYCFNSNYYEYTHNAYLKKNYWKQIKLIIKGNKKILGKYFNKKLKLFFI